MLGGRRFPGNDDITIFENPFALFQHNPSMFGWSFYRARRFTLLGIQRPPVFENPQQQPLLWSPHFSSSARPRPTDISRSSRYPSFRCPIWIQCWNGITGCSSRPNKPHFFFKAARVLLHASPASTNATSPSSSSSKPAGLFRAQDLPPALLPRIFSFLSPGALSTRQIKAVLRYAADRTDLERKIGEWWALDDKVSNEERPSIPRLAGQADVLGGDGVLRV